MIVRVRCEAVAVDASAIEIAGESTVVEFESAWGAHLLVEADPDGEGLRILCGQEIGTIAVTAELWDAPPELDAESWQDVAEVATGWTSPMMDFGTTTWAEPSSVLPVPEPGDYRVRVHGRNRDDGDPRNDDDPVEEYLIQVWAAPLAPGTVLKTTSELDARRRER
jgi:hypothetical protein